VLYADFECPRCGLAYERLRSAGVNLGLRHFPVASKHPLSRGAAFAAEAAAEFGLFWKMVDSLFKDQGRLDVPHLWERAQAIGIEARAFEAVRTSELVKNRVEESFRLAIRAGVASTPTIFYDDQLHQDVPSLAECGALACRPAA
jgi:protein-disulfide isomerase